LVATGRVHSCAVTSTGTIRCWGNADKGQLGNGIIDGTSTGEYATPIDVLGITGGTTDIASFMDHTCAVVSGTVMCWGENSEGQLGNGSTTPSATPVSASLPSGFTAAHVTVGEEHSCALSTSGAVICWGKNDYGQLGDGSNAANSPTPVAVSSLGSGVTRIAAGATHTCAVQAGGALCWGSNLYGEIGFGVMGNGLHTPQAVDAVSGFTVADVGAGQNFSCAISTAGALECWGRNDSGQLGNGQGGFNADQYSPVPVSGVTAGATQVSGGYGSTCAIISGAAKCWGSNLDYTLGGGGSPSDEFHTPQAVVGLSSGVTAIAATCTDHACAVGSGGAVLCWGSGSAALGNGDDLTDQASPYPVTSFP